jgi:hypothetical protein
MPNTDDLINTLDTSGEFDALAKLRPGEPYFALIGRDRLAPQLVLEWAHRNRTRTHEDFDNGRVKEEEHHRELRKSTQAETVAWAMQAYKKGHPTDSALVETAETDHYSGFVIDEETAARDRMQQMKARSSNRIHNGIAAIHEAAELLIGTDDLETVAALNTLNMALRNIADALVPPRRGIDTVAA